MYELKIANGGLSSSTVSIDSSYNNHRAYRQWHEVITDHQPQEGEIELQKGDIIEIISSKVSANKSMGYGLNKITGFSGFYPLNKVKKRIKIVEYPGLA